MVLPAESPKQDDTAFMRLGGEAAVRALVEQFYDLMDLEPRFADIRRLHPGSLDGSRDKLHWFLCGWLGGPQHYTPASQASAVFDRHPRT